MNMYLKTFGTKFHNEICEILRNNRQIAQMVYISGTYGLLQIYLHTRNLYNLV